MAIRFPVKTICDFSQVAVFTNSPFTHTRAWKHYGTPLIDHSTSLALRYLSKRYLSCLLLALLCPRATNVCSFAIHVPRFVRDLVLPSKFSFLAELDLQ